MIRKGLPGLRVTLCYFLKLGYLERSWWAQRAKNLPALQETQVQSLGWEDLLEEGTAPHSSILARRIPWTEEPGSTVSQRIGHD